MGDIFAKAQLFKALRLTNVGIFERDQGACVAHMCGCVIVSFGKDKISDNWIEHRWDITLRKLITMLQVSYPMFLARGREDTQELLVFSSRG